MDVEAPTRLQRVVWHPLDEVIGSWWLRLGFILGFLEAIQRQISQVLS
jgi:hypothetical protein